MNRRPKLPAVTVGAVAVLVLAGCGGNTPEKAAGPTPPPSPAPAAGSSPAPSAAPALKPGEVRVAGQVDKPYTVTLDSLRGLPQQSVEVEYTSAKGQQKHSYQGVLLHDVLKDAQPRFDASKKNGQLRGVVAATGGGDYRAVFAWAELDPAFAKSQVLLAVSEDGKPFDAAGGPRLVVPQDTKGGRYVSELNQLWVGTVDAAVDSGADGAGR
ncbi:molybdopterin-dependent oxidoreductase [Streptomyces sp. NPDC090077]|uniref:molybdopterin-dependent oxidoreductase n=1 Tax=Streptomyces sp. NPDC090077 TaxID=3365938 RepID=UPI00382CE35C